jgi:quercetin dioxygenase-like cupin family protein
MSEPAGEYPRTIAAGNGEELTFVAIGRDDEGEYLEVSNEVQPGAGPPMHTHLRQRESLTIDEGTMGYQELGGPEHRATVGETVVFERGVAHKFWNAGEGVLRAHGTVRPPDNLEYFLTEMYASIERNGGTRPGIFDSAYLLQRYRTEFRMHEIPGPVQKLLFPLVVRAGSLLGKDRRFAGAPEPIAG